jgi:hypothetical protein
VQLAHDRFTDHRADDFLLAALLDVAPTRSAAFSTAVALTAAFARLLESGDDLGAVVRPRRRPS